MRQCGHIRGGKILGRVGGGSPPECRLGGQRSAASPGDPARQPALTPGGRCLRPAAHGSVGGFADWARGLENLSEGRRAASQEGRHPRPTPPSARRRPPVGMQLAGGRGSRIGAGRPCPLGRGPPARSRGGAAGASRATPPRRPRPGRRQRRPTASTTTTRGRGGATGADEPAVSASEREDLEGPAPPRLEFRSP